MKILVIADEESKKLWDYYEPGMLDKYDLILSCGDLSPHYLEFLVTMSNKDLLYVHGNHDRCYDTTPPLGCTCIDDKVYNFRGLRILGLGGSYRYRESSHMYTEKEMRRRVSRLRFQLWRSKGFDILLTHAPALGINHGKDLPHRGFRTFIELMDKYAPAYFIHGHVHRNYSDGYRRDDYYRSTHIINASGTYELDIPDELIAKQEEARKSKKKT